MAAKDRYKEILELLPPGDEAVVQEVVSDAFAEGEASVHKRAERREQGEWGCLGAICIGLLALGLLLGSAAGGGCYENSVKIAASKKTCIDACSPYASRDRNELVGDKYEYMCECAVDKTTWKEVALPQE